MPGTCRQTQIILLFVVLLSAQSIFCRPIEDSLEKEIAKEQNKTNGTDFEKLILSRKGNFMLIPQKYADEVANATKHLLKDETLLDNREPEVIEFKNKLSLFLDKYEPSASLKATHENMDYFFNITQPYLEMTEDKQTPNSKFIIELLNNHKFSEFATMDEIEAGIDEWRANASTAEKLLIFTLDGLITIPQQYAANATNATRYLLKDQAFESMDQAEVLEFKKKLTEFLDKYDPTTSDMTSIYKSMNVFADITNYYGHPPVEEVNAETKIIVELLNKYNCKSIAMPMLNYFETFLENFIVIFEECKEDLEKPMLDWFEKFKTLKGWQAKFESMSEFIDMV